MILINVTVTANPGQEEAFKALLLETMAASRAEEGCVEYRFTADLSQSGTFHLVELWRDEAALNGHFATPTFAHFINALSPLGELVSSVAYSGDLAPYEIRR
ncbi:MAG: hypothetical protein VR73_13115 [Gammaproteobacteria bacterium BRH_c0]|nr:MAG: hypothetical protein VR73_13115 [Gammaproteobacteria bacterium BRH_c0]